MYTEVVEDAIGITVANRVGSTCPVVIIVIPSYERSEGHINHIMKRVQFHLHLLRNTNFMGLIIINYIISPV